VLGFIGVGGMGTARLREFMKQPDVRIGAICDVDRRHLDRAVGLVEQGAATSPNVWRLPQAARSARHRRGGRGHARPLARHPDRRGVRGRQGRVRREAPELHVAEGRAMADASLRHRASRRWATTSTTSGPTTAAWWRWCSLARSGASPARTAGRRSTRGPSGRSSRRRAAGTRLRLLAGPGAPKRPYHPLRSHFTYRHFWDYSGGMFIDFWCHIVDVAVWALDLQAPRAWWPWADASP
jgi:hypothetical protein